MPPSHCTKSHSFTSNRRTNPSSFFAHRSCDSTSNDPTTQPSPAASPRVANPSWRAPFINARKTDETSRSESDDPVCRPIRRFLFRLSLFRLSFHLACAAKPLGAELRASRLRGTIVSGRFRARKLVGSSRYSKCFFAGVQCFAIMTRPWPLCRIFWRRGHAAHLAGRYAEGRAQGPLAKTMP